MNKRVEIGIGGRGLGSGSLTWVEELADQFQIRGVAFTKSDGSIKVSAEGDEENLQEFARRLEKGSIFSSVENFYVKWHQTNDRSRKFYALSGC